MIQSRHETLFIGHQYQHLAQCASTNEEMKTLSAGQSLPEGAVVSTGYQTAGRGQAGASWESGPDLNIMLSVLLYPRFIDSASQFAISKAIALAVYEFCGIFVPRESLAIKWPNDILADGDKICGILIENGLKGNKIEYCIAGIGININEKALPPGRTSMAIITGLEYELKYLENVLFACIEARYLQLKSNPASVSDDYLKALYRYGVNSVFRDHIRGELFEGAIEGIEPDGRLRIETPNGYRIFSLKEISFG